MAKAKKAAHGASDNAKTLAIVAHITWIGWLIALIVDKDKSPLTRFYLRQNLILFLFGLLSAIPILGIIIGIGVLVLWIMSLVGAINGEQKVVPLVGKYGQQWFKGL